MRVIRAINVNDAWPMAIELMDDQGYRSPSRNGDVTVVSYPVATVYARPTERVLFDPVRDANPFFHLHEALWMLAGRDDADWLDVFVKDFSSRFSEEGGRMHGAYGRRWRSWFWRPDEPDSESGHVVDQLDIIVELLRSDPTDRQAVLQMWDAEADLGVKGLKDRPCNTQAYFRADRGVLDMTVTCRSNDIVYGCYGANVVHFSVLLEYMAARIGIPVGVYTQVSNNFHLYDWALQRVDYDSAVAHSFQGLDDPYPGTKPIVEDPDAFDDELRQYLEDPDEACRTRKFRNPFFAHVATPMWHANQRRLEGNYAQAMLTAEAISAPDWRRACVEWLARRAPKGGAS